MNKISPSCKDFRTEFQILEGMIQWRFLKFLLEKTISTSTIIALYVFVTQQSGPDLRVCELARFPAAHWFSFYIVVKKRFRVTDAGRMLFPWSTLHPFLTHHLSHRKGTSLPTSKPVTFVRSVWRLCAAVIQGTLVERLTSSLWPDYVDNKTVVLGLLERLDVIVKQSCSVSVSRTRTSDWKSSLNDIV